MAADGTVVEYAAGPLDPYGNVTTVTSANETQCTRVTFDSAYSQFPVHTSRGCSGATLDEFVLAYDLGLGKATTTSGTSNDVSTIRFDTFGRTAEIHDPDYTVPGAAFATPSILVEYVEDAVAHVRRTHTTAYARESWVWNDALGNKLATFVAGDPTSDGAAWIANDAARFYGNGAIQTAYPPMLWTGDDPRTASLVTFSKTALTHVGQNATYDAFGRAVKLTATDGVTLLQSTQFHAMTAVVADGEDSVAGGLHANTPTTIQRDGFGRTVGVTVLEKHAGVVDQVTTATSYLPTGEIDAVTRSHTGGSDTFVRHNTYDSMGRMVKTTEPNSDVPPVASGQQESQLATWTYAYDYAGNLVGTSDARGCGKNVLYDTLGRPLAYDFSPCLSAQAVYTPPLANGDGTEAFFVYDHADVGQSLSPIQTAAAEGRLTGIYDQAAHTQFAYDSRGHAVQVTRRIAAPVGTPALSTRYSTAAFTKSYTYDPGALLLTAETTGANDPSLLVSGKSAISYGYSASGRLGAVAGSYGQLLAFATYDPSGRRLTTWYGDAASTTKTAHYTAAGLLDSLLVSRAAGPWAKQTGSYTPPSSSLGPTSLQEVLIHDAFAYDQAANPTAVTDLRGAEWPSGAKPVSRAFVYDDAYRLTQAKYNSGGDIPGAPVVSGAYAMPMLRPPSRVKEQDFLYDWMGNTTSSTSDDDADGFFDRSIGTITNGNAGKNPNQLSSATGPGGTLSAAYDAAGNMVSLLVIRSGACTDPSGECTMRFAYDWDEVNRLSRARRWNYAGAYTGPQYPSLPTSTPDVDVHYAYDAGGQRVMKSVLPAPAATGRVSCGVLCQPKLSFNVDIFDSLRLNGAGWNGTSYQDDDSTETVYVSAADARVFNDSEGQMPAAVPGPHVFFEVGDHLGSTAAIIDKASGELVERDTYQAYGASESDYQPVRWAGFHEAFQFTSKENDSEVGLTYFGARYYSPSLGRWISPDPLTIHAMGADLNPYAYVGGNTTATTDPWGLDPPSDTIFDTILPDGSAVGTSASGGTTWEFYDAPLQNNDPASARNCFAMSCHTSYAPQYDPFAPVLRQVPVAVGNGIAAVGNVVASNLKEVGQNTENFARYLGVPDFDIQLFKTMPDSPVTMAEVPVQLATVFVAMSEVKVAVTDLRVARAYSVAFQMQLDATQLGLSRGRHFAIANEALAEARAASPELAGLVPEAAGRASPPPDWVWQHATIKQGGGEAGVMQLVPKGQHTAGSPFWRILHPLPNGGGGYSEWAIPAGAPPN